MTNITSKIILLATVLFFYSCDKNDNETSKRLLGNEVKLEHGTLQSFVQLNAAGRPASVGFTFSEGILHHLPYGDTSFILTMPNGNNTLIDHISFDWTSHGHEPPGIYDVPHFDVHFYMVSQAERNLIDPASADMEEIPGPEFFPVDYVPTPGGLPQMGKHWIDTTSAELRGQPFTQTFIHGSYNGKFHFYEPMIALSYLEAKPNAEFIVKQAQKISREGFHPTKYSIRYDAVTHLYSIALDGLAMRTK